MPPKNVKQSKGNAAKKEQVAEKVKEIQMRQKNWFREREDHLKKASEPSTAPTQDRGYTTKTDSENVRVKSPPIKKAGSAGKTNAERAREFRERMRREDPERWKYFCQKNNERNRRNRLQPKSDERLAREREMARFRVKKYRERLKAEKLAKIGSLDAPPVKRRTQRAAQKPSDEVQAQRDKWAESKRKERQKWPVEKWNRHRHVNLQRYHLQKLEEALAMTPTEESSPDHETNTQKTNAERYREYRAAILADPERYTDECLKEWARDRRKLELPLSKEQKIKRREDNKKQQREWRAQKKELQLKLTEQTSDSSKVPRAKKCKTCSETKEKGEALLTEHTPASSKVPRAKKCKTCSETKEKGEALLTEHTPASSTKVPRAKKRKTCSETKEKGEAQQAQRKEWTETKKGQHQQCTEEQKQLEREMAKQCQENAVVQSSSKGINTPAPSHPGPPHRADILQVHHDASENFASQVSDKLNVNVKHNLSFWLQSRNKHGQSNDAPNSDTKNGVDDEGDFTRGHDPKTVAVRDHSYSLASSGVSSVHSSSNRSHLLSPEEFDSLADNIASRVKKDLGIVNGTRIAEGREGLNRGRTFLQNEPDVLQVSVKLGSGDHGQNGEADVGNHRCPFCTTVMVDAQHVPTLLVPCGHTVCKVCAVSHIACRLCGIKVVSLTTNIMLQQIIQEYHHTIGRHKGLPSELQCESQSEGMMDPPKTTAKQRDVNYTSQLRSLMDRQATLEDEASSHRRARDSITSKVKRVQKQLSGIQREESGLVEQLKQLEERLDSLRHHKEEYTGELAQLQEEQRLAVDHVTTLERTLKSLGEEIDKVQFLAEGQTDMYTKKGIQKR